MLVHTFLMTKKRDKQTTMFEQLHLSSGMAEACKIVGEGAKCLKMCPILEIKTGHYGIMELIVNFLLKIKMVSL